MTLTHTHTHTNRIIIKNIANMNNKQDESTATITVKRLKCKQLKLSIHGAWNIRIDQKPIRRFNVFGMSRNIGQVKGHDLRDTTFQLNAVEQRIFCEIFSSLSLFSGKQQQYEFVPLLSNFSSRVSLAIWNYRYLK